VKSLIKSLILVGVLIFSIVLVLVVGLQILAQLFPAVFSDILPASLLNPSTVRINPDSDDVYLPNLLPQLWGYGGPSMAAFFLFSALALIAWRLLGRKEARPHQDRLDETESRMMQEMHHGLTRLEDKVESLESVLLRLAERNVEERKPEEKKT
jgi:hypothetical protein